MKYWYDFFKSDLFFYTFRKILEEQITPVILYVEEHAEDDGEVHEADEDDHHHARVNPYPTSHIWKQQKEMLRGIWLTIAINCVQFFCKPVNRCPLKGEQNIVDEKLD